MHCHPYEFGARNSEVLSYYEIVIFRRVRKNCEKRLLASSCPSFRPSVRMELGSHWMDFHENLYMSIFFLKTVDKIEVSLTLILLTWRIW